ncbi:MAG TPA: gliding motility protein GldC [Cytophagales bacterium]|jgi:gliding motility-associated protein GldC|nr:gliding motility protein GldC [Cytophagales bacterium]
MKKSKINLEIDLDKQNIPEKITWTATDNPDGDVAKETNAISLSMWDHSQRNTLRIDLWTKEMPVDEMKRFYIDCLGGLAQSILNATGDEYMSNEMNALCDRFVEHLKKEMEN